MNMKLGFLAQTALALFSFQLPAMAVSVSENPESRQVCEILKDRSPDDMTEKESVALRSIGRKTANGTIDLTEEAGLLLARAFVFGRSDRLKPDCVLASNLVDRVFGKTPDEDGDPELLFVRATILGRTAQTCDALDQANRLLAQAATNGWPEAMAKIHRGGFFYEDSTKNRSGSSTKQIIKGLVEKSIMVNLLVSGNPIGPSIIFGRKVYQALSGKSPKEKIAILNQTTEELYYQAAIMENNLSDPRMVLAEYDAVRTVSALLAEDAEDADAQRERVDLLLGRLGGTFLGSERMQPFRTVIVCTPEACKLFDKENTGLKTKKDKVKDKAKQIWTGKDELREYRFSSTFFEGSDCKMRTRSQDDFLAMPKGDIIRYNQEIAKLYPNESCKALVFDPGHPKNGCTYLQHPHRKNEYIEISEFPMKILREKADELDRVLSSLGATNIHVCVLNAESREDVDEEELTGRVGASVGAEEAEGAAKLAFIKNEFNRRKMSVRYDVHREKHAPEYPRGADFPFFNEPDQIEWRRLSKDVCDGKRKKDKFLLSFESDSRCSEQRVGEIEVAVRDGLVDGRIGVGWKIKSSFLLNSLLVWECEASF